MRLRNVKNAKEIIENSKYSINYNDATSHKGNIKKLFGNDKPICIEIGMGKGQFLIKMAKAHPDVNYIGIELYESVLCRAVEKLETEELDNIKVLCCNAENLEEVFDAEIDKIYLNFSDPWPKNRHAKRRLTSHVFLPIYDKLFKGEKVIIQKTDNVLLFASSIVSLSTYGYVISECNMDLANSDLENYTTEYEDKFNSLGVKINYLKAIKK